jgi:SOS-response transcriptional repressor LexA
MKSKNPHIISSSKSLDKEFYNIPLFGEVRIEPDGHFQGDYDLGEIITNSRKNEQESLNVRAADNGLSGAGIFKNDFLTVQLNIGLADGDIAVVKLGPKIYIRKIFFEKKHIRLETDSGTPSPFIIDRETPGFEIIGKVTTVIREL